MPDDASPLPTHLDRVMCLRCGFGDVVMALPALRAWRAEQARPVLWLATRPGVDLAEVLAQPGDAVGTYLQLGLEHWGDAGDAAVRRRCARWVSGLGPRTRFTGLMHAPEGLRDAAVDAGFGQTNAQEDQPVELAAAQAGAGTAAFVSEAAAAGWGLRGVPPGHATLEPPRRHRAAADAFLHAVGLPRPGRPLLAAAVNGGSDLKVWPPERLAAALLGRPAGMDALLVAGPDAERAAAVQRRLPGPLPELGPVHLLTAAAVLARCDALLTNDSGLLHLAAAVGTPCVAVFGPTAARFYMPRVSRGGPPAGEAVEAPRGGPGGVPCPLREPEHLGPPACILRGGCRWDPGAGALRPADAPGGGGTSGGGLRSCIDRVPVAAVSAALERVLEGSGGGHLGQAAAAAPAAPAAGGSALIRG